MRQVGNCGTLVVGFIDATRSRHLSQKRRHYREGTQQRGTSLDTGSMTQVQGSAFSSDEQQKAQLIESLLMRLSQTCPAILRRT
jgi:hypothetical protein